MRRPKGSRTSRPPTASRCAGAGRANARRLSCATSSPRSPPRGSASCAAPPTSTTATSAPCARCCRTPARERAMPRVKRGVTARARHKKVLKKSKGFRGRRGNVYRVAKQAVMKAGQYAYRDRRNRKRVIRALWITRINAAVRELGMSYSAFMAALKKPTIQIDRKVLADLAVLDKPAFAKIAGQIKASLAH